MELLKKVEAFTEEIVDFGKAAPAGLIATHTTTEHGLSITHKAIETEEDSFGFAGLVKDSDFSPVTETELKEIADACIAKLKATGVAANDAGHIVKELLALVHIDKYDAKYIEEEMQDAVEYLVNNYNKYKFSFMDQLACIQENSRHGWIDIADDFGTGVPGAQIRYHLWKTLTQYETTKDVSKMDIEYEGIKVLFSEEDMQKLEEYLGTDWYLLSTYIHSVETLLIGECASVMFFDLDNLLKIKDLYLQFILSTPKSEFEEIRELMNNSSDNYGGNYALAEEKLKNMVSLEKILAVIQTIPEYGSVASVSEYFVDAVASEIEAGAAAVAGAAQNIRVNKRNAELLAELNDISAQMLFLADRFRTAGDQIERAEITALYNALLEIYEAVAAKLRSCTLARDASSEDRQTWQNNVNESQRTFNGALRQGLLSGIIGLDEAWAAMAEINKSLALFMENNGLLADFSAGFSLQAYLPELKISSASVVFDGAAEVVLAQLFKVTASAYELSRKIAEARAAEIKEEKLAEKRRESVALELGISKTLLRLITNALGIDAKDIDLAVLRDMIEKEILNTPTWENIAGG